MDEPVRAHALLSPSGSDRWLTCPGSVLLTKDAPDVTSEYAEEGTDYHELAAVCLEEETDAAQYIGHALPSGKRYVTEENALFLQTGYLDPLRAYATGGTLLVEEKCPIEHLTGEPGAKGTADAVVIRPDDELIIGDLKFGRGVEVQAEDNRQTRIYALGVIEKHQLAGTVKTVRIVIFQPRAGDGKPKEWVVSMADLLAFGEEVKYAASQILCVNGVTGALEFTEGLPLVPSEKACKFCKAKADCTALTTFVGEAMREGFDNLDAPTPVLALERTPATLSRPEYLGRAMDRIDLIEIYMKGVQAAVEVELLAGRPVIGSDGPYKLVQGKKGNRKWDDEEAVEALLKDTFRLASDEIYNKKVISPTDAEKLFKKLDAPRRWAKVTKHITQSEGGKHVANAKDPRPAIEHEKPEVGFGVVSEAEEFL